MTFVAKAGVGKERELKHEAKAEKKQSQKVVGQTH